jgi:LAGLIDADG endonuclease
MNNNEFGNKSNVLNPNFITGLSDAEGCFSIRVFNNKRVKFKRNVQLGFTIKMLENETELLTMVKLFFNCGVLWHYRKDGTVWFRVQDIYSIKNKIIPHFIKYPLRGTKYLDFISFKEAFHIIESKEHLEEEGLNKLYALSKGMNRGRKFSIDNLYSPDHTKENNTNYIPLDGHYVNGFIAGDGCLILQLGKTFGIMNLSISQHINNRLLMESIAKYFKSSSKIYIGRPKDIQIILNGVQLWENVIFKHFEKYPIYGTKKLRLNKLLLIRELKRDNKHLIQVGKFRQWKSDIKLRIIEIWNN